MLLRIYGLENYSIHRREEPSRLSQAPQFHLTLLLIIVAIYCRKVFCDRSHLLCEFNPALLRCLSSDHHVR